MAPTANPDHFFIYADTFNLLCGDKIGSGIHRDVFECRVRPDLVVKVETETHWRYFANVREMQFWSEHQYARQISKWLAPCEYMSPDGRILLQKRAEPIPKNYKLPATLPTFLTDIGRKNFGLYNGQLVCLDYATTIPNPSLKMRKANWE